MSGWKIDWIIGISSSAVGSAVKGVQLETVYGTERQVKKYLLNLVKKDKMYDWSWEEGTKKLSDIEELRIFKNPRNGVMNTGFYAYNNFRDYRIVYTAAPALPAKDLRG